MVVIYKQGKKLLTGIESVSSLSVYLWYIVIAKTCLIPKHKNHTFLFVGLLCNQKQDFMQNVDTHYNFPSKIIAILHFNERKNPSEF